MQIVYHSLHSKEVLAELAYKMNELAPFEQPTGLFSWCSPTVGFSYNNSLPYDFMKALKKIDNLPIQIDNVICVLGDWKNVAEGIILTDTCIFCNSQKNGGEHFCVFYKDIKGTRYTGRYTIRNKIKKALALDTMGGGSYNIENPIWNHPSIHDFLHFASGLYDFEQKAVLDIYLEESKSTVGNIASGAVCL